MIFMVFFEKYPWFWHVGALVCERAREMGGITAEQTSLSAVTWNLGLCGRQTDPTRGWVPSVPYGVNGSQAWLTPSGISPREQEQENCLDIKGQTSERLMRSLIPHGIIVRFSFLFYFTLLFFIFFLYQQSGKPGWDCKGNTRYLPPRVKAAVVACGLFLLMLKMWGLFFKVQKNCHHICPLFN